MHTANQPYNVLDGADKQSNPRSADDLARLNRYSSVLRAYCAAGDPVCAKGSVIADHLNYFQLYTDEASSWVVSKIDNTAPVCGATSSSVTPAASATAPAGSPAASGGYSGPSYPIGGANNSSSPAPYATPSKVESVPVAPYPTSKATPSPFPAPQAYDSCVVVYEVEYVYV